MIRILPGIFHSTGTGGAQRGAGAAAPFTNPNLAVTIYFRRQTLDIGKKCISMIVTVCYLFMCTGCYTTDNIYEDKEVTLTLAEVVITSHQNDMGVLYYTVDGMYRNNSTGSLEKIGNDFPLSTYSDAVLYKNEHADDFEKVIVTTRKEFVKEEKVYSPGKTFLITGLPVLGALTLFFLIFIDEIFPPSNQ